MRSHDESGISRRVVMGSAGVAIASPLFGIAEKTHANVPGSAHQMQSLAVPSAGVARQSAGAAEPPLDVRSYGVVGDGRADDTRAVQKLLDLCAEQGGRTAYFGALTVRITGPLRSRGVGIVFDTASYGANNAPGFVASGAGYVALTVTGSVSDFCLTLTGDGTADITVDGHVAGDRRPKIDGIVFGSGTDPFALSTVRWVRVNNLAGVGIRNVQCWDSTFVSVSVERCGRDGGGYAFEVRGDSGQTCNETTWVRLQVEQSVGGSIYIHPNTLSCSFTKIHSERAIARRNMPTWLLGGACVFDSVRLTAANAAEASVSIIGNQTEFRNLRAEDAIPVTVDASGGTINFHNPGGVLRPARDQSGLINIFGGVVSVLAMGSGWNLFGSKVGLLEIGFMPAGGCSTLTGCRVDELSPQPGADQGELMLTATQVAAATLAGKGRLRALYLNDNSQLVAKGGLLSCADQLIAVDATSGIVGNVALQRVSLRFAGAISGNLAIMGPVHDARATDGARVGGSVTGWGPPTVPGTTGAWSINLATSGVKQVRGVREAVIGWRYVADMWRSVRMDTGV